MAKRKKTATRYVDVISRGIVTKLIGTKKELDFTDLKILRKLFSNEKVRIIHTLKTKKPSSIYSLAKILKRDLKSVRQDLKVLERFGFVDFVLEKKGRRESLRPILVINRLQIIMDI